MIFKDYTVTKKVYHVVSLADLDNVLRNGLKYDDKKTFKTKYNGFHQCFDEIKGTSVPEWVVRSRAIFASMNFQKDHKWHSHTALIGITIDEAKCWVCNENIANLLYEPFILQNTCGFDEAKEFMKKFSGRIVEDYWKSSLSFSENQNCRKDKEVGYDAEVLVMHHIPPENIECIYVISDHRILSCTEWKEAFASGRLCYENC